MNVLVYGGTGMLGHQVVRECVAAGFRVSASYREEHETLCFDHGNVHWSPARIEEGDDSFKHLLMTYPPPDYIINCVGVIKPYIAKDPSRAVYVNSYFPWKLAKQCEAYGICKRVIHISTDCVYDGLASGHYDEKDPHTARDLYGQSKSLGEPTTPNCLTLRTSIIGPELHAKVSLYEWFLAQKGEVKGFLNHHWTGVTTKAFGQACVKIIKDGFWVAGLRHIYTEAVTKAELLELFNERLTEKKTILPVYSPDACDRTLVTKHPDFLSKLNLPSLREMIAAL